LPVDPDDDRVSIFFISVQLPEWSLWILEEFLSPFYAKAPHYLSRYLLSFSFSHFPIGSGRTGRCDSTGVFGIPPSSFLSINFFPPPSLIVRLSHGLFEPSECLPHRPAADPVPPWSGPLLPGFLTTILPIESSTREVFSFLPEGVDFLLPEKLFPLPVGMFFPQRTFPPSIPSSPGFVLTPFQKPDLVRLHFRPRVFLCGTAFSSPFRHACRVSCFSIFPCRSPPLFMRAACGPLSPPDALSGGALPLET